MAKIIVKMMVEMIVNMLNSMTVMTTNNLIYTRISSEPMLFLPRRLGMHLMAAMSTFPSLSAMPFLSNRYVKVCAFIFASILCHFQIPAAHAK